MKASTSLLVVFALWFSNASVPVANAQAATVARTIAKQLTETLGKRGAQELAEAGGEAAVREMIEKAAQEGGEQLAREVAGYAERYGSQSLRAFREAPAAMAQGMRKVPAELAESAMRAAAREPEAIARLAAAVGEDALIVAAKHPGVGVDIASKLGREGCSVAKELSTIDAIRLARFSDDLAKLPAVERGNLLSRIGKAPGKVMDYLEKHPNVLKTAAAASGAFVLIDRMVGNPGVPGFLERVMDKFYWPLATLIGAVGVLLLVCLWRRFRHRNRASNLVRSK